MCKIGEVGNYEIREYYEKMCNEGILKHKFQIVERIGLTHALEFLKKFKVGWIKVVLRRIHDMKYWLQNSPVEITKKMIHRVTGYPTLDKKKTMWCLSHEEVKAKTGAECNGCGLSITNISSPLIEFIVRVIAHNYQLSILDNVPCMVFDQAWKIVMKDHEYDLAKLQRL